MITPREEAHAVVEYCPHGSKHPHATHSDECDQLAEVIETNRVAGIAVGVLVARAQERRGISFAAAMERAARKSGLDPDRLAQLLPRTIASFLTVLFLLFTHPARAADPVPFFKPDYFQFFKPEAKPTPQPAKPYGPPRPHRIATECAVDDRACIRAHDERALDLAFFTHDRSWCSQAVRASWCTALYEFVYDDGPAVKRTAHATDPMLYDPCTFVVSIDSGRATLYSFRLKRWLVTKDESWERAEFIGECAVDKLPPRLVQGVQTLPGFPWVTAKRRGP